MTTANPLLTVALTSKKMQDIDASIRETILGYREIGQEFGYNLGVLIAEMLEYYREKVHPSNIWLLKVNGQHVEEHQMKIGFYSCIRQAKHLVKDGCALARPVMYGHVMGSLLYKQPQERETLYGVKPLDELLSYAEQWGLDGAVDLMRPMLHGLALLEESNLRLVFLSAGERGGKDDKFQALYANDEGSEYYEVMIDGQALHEDLDALIKTKH